MQDIIRVNEIESKYKFVKVGVTTSSLNMRKIEDRVKLCLELGFYSENLTNNSQVHSDIVNVVKEEDVGAIKEGDALVTNLKNVPLITYVADCVPIAFLDPINKAIGVAHAGWRGTFAKIGIKTIETMSNNYGTKVEDVICFIGPSIGKYCYNVGHDLALKFKNEFDDIMPDIEIFEDVNGEYFLNLWAINEYSLKSVGVKGENIINYEYCTNCNKDKFHSYRAHNQTDKRIGLIIGLTE